jgi:diacylglycerol kinase family enzyme
VREARRGGAAGIRLVSGVGMAFLRMLRRYLPRRLVIEAAGTRTIVRSPSITVAVNAVDEPGGRPFGRSALDQGELAAYVVGRLTLAHTAGLVIAWLRGTWRQHTNIQEIRAPEVTLHAGRRAVRVMNDGEHMLLHPPLSYRIRPGALRVCVP